LAQEEPSFDHAPGTEAAIFADFLPRSANPSAPFSCFRELRSAVSVERDVKWKAPAEHKYRRARLAKLGSEQPVSFEDLKRWRIRPANGRTVTQNLDVSRLEY
jgi:hypothetical protein